MVPALIALILTASQPRSLGRTYAQILAMGRERWRVVVEREGGASRANRANGEWDYGQAAAWGNDRLLARTKRPARRALARDLRAFRRHAAEAGDAIDGGGTAWGTVWCETHADVEVAIGAILAGQARAGRASTATVDQQVRELGTELERAVARSSNAGLGLYVRRGRESLRAMKNAWIAVVHDGRRLPWRDSGASFACCSALLSKVLKTL